MLGYILKLAFSKVEAEAVRIEVRKVAISAAEKYAVKAREFHKMSIRIAEEAGAKTGAMLGEEIGEVAGEEAGGIIGEKVGREAGQKAAVELAGPAGAKPGAEAGAKAGKRFGLKIGRETGARVGLEFGESLGRTAGGKAGAEEALKAFKIGISKEKVAALKRLFAEVGEAAGKLVATTEAKVKAVEAAEEEARKFALEEGAKAGAGVARKIIADEARALRDVPRARAQGRGRRVGRVRGGDRLQQVALRASRASEVGEDC